MRFYKSNKQGYKEEYYFRRNSQGCRAVNAITAKAGGVNLVLRDSNAATSPVQDGETDGWSSCEQVFLRTMKKNV